ncbi:MAG: hypothetical protein GX555_02060 [Actinomycetales bacterium]|nr:hypothetical protein [Actinomycetales bacterium]
MTTMTPTRPHTPSRTDRQPDVDWHQEVDRITRHTASLPTGPTTARLFVDLTSPWAYLAHLRLADSADDITWTAVQRLTAIPRTGLRSGGRERDELQRQLEAARYMAGADEELPAIVPSVLPHPRTVAAAYAEAVDLGCGAAVRETLLEAYWLEGKDIGDPEVLRRILPPVVVEEGALCTGDPRREFGYLVSPAREPLTDSAYHLMARWQQEWEDVGRPGPLALVDADGSITTGPAVLLP